MYWMAYEKQKGLMGAKDKLTPITDSDVSLDDLKDQLEKYYEQIAYENAEYELQGQDIHVIEEDDDGNESEYNIRIEFQAEKPFNPRKEWGTY